MSVVDYNFIDREFIRLHTITGQELYLRADAVTAIEEVETGRGEMLRSMIYVEGSSHGFEVKQSSDDILYSLGICERCREQDREDGL